MVARFLTPLQVEQIDKDDWKLLGPLVYWSVVLDRQLIVPEGFVTDFASVPRLPFIYWAAGGCAEAPAVLHDWLYRTGTEKASREQADGVFKEAIESRQYYWRLRAWTMWAGVRVGGYFSYKSRTKDSTDPIVG